MFDQKNVISAPGRQFSVGNLEAMFLESPEAIFAIDMKGRIIFVNKRFQELLGYDLEELNALKEELVHGDGADLEQQIVLAVNGISTVFKTVLKSKSGHLISAEVFLLPVLDRAETGFILGFCQVEENIELSRFFPSTNNPGTIMNIGTWKFDLETKECIWSKEMHEIFGTDPDSFTPSLRSFFQFIHPDDRRMYRRALRDSVKKGTSSVLLYRIFHTSGQMRHILVRIDSVTNEEGKILYLTGSAEHITGTNKEDERMTISNSTLLTIANHLYAVIWSYSCDLEKITFCSTGIERIFGIRQEAFMENPFVLTKFLHPEDLDFVEKVKAALQNGENHLGHFRLVDESGNIKWVHAVFIPVFDEEGKLSRVDGVFQDITKEKNYTEALSRLAYFDNLTKLPNRHYFEDYVNKCIQESKLYKEHFAVFYLDLDMFDYINDTYGHEVGDKLLAAISRRLKTILDEKAFLSRIAGDEFAILIEDVTEVTEALPYAEQIIEEMNPPFYVEGYELSVTVSIGISFFPDDGEDAHTLLKNANQALKRVQNNGKSDCQIYSPSLDIKTYKSYQLENDLHQAIEKDEFYLVYQPKVDAVTKQIKGTEALIRWEHPDWGTVSPGEFIRMAEENGYIFEIGDWVLKQVCRDLKRWEKEGIPLVPVSVNISPKRLLKADFVETVKKLITEAGIDPDYIEIEITEYVVLKDIEKAEQIISELKAFGVRFALDDFGTGYSSLSYLMDLDFDTLKIDKSFIDGIGSNKINEGIIKGTIYLAKQLGLEVVAEGVEEVSQLNFLQRQKCDLIQGFLFSRPVREREIKKLLAEGTLEIRRAAKPLPPVKNRRKYKRLKFDIPLQAEMTVLKIKDKPLKLGMSKALIKDISLGGLRYLSNVNLPVQEDFILLFVTEIFGKERKFRGRNVWKSHVNGLYQYGVEFTISDEERSQFEPVLNKMSHRLKSNDPLPNTRFLTEDVFHYFE